MRYKEISIPTSGLMLLMLFLAPYSSPQDAPAAKSNLPGQVSTSTPIAPARSCSPTIARAQEFTVVSAYKNQGAYLAAARKNANADLASLYRSCVADANWKKCAEGSEYIYNAENAVKTPITDLDSLTYAVSTLSNSGVEKVVEDSLHHLSELLPGPDTMVFILAADPREGHIRSYMSGVKGSTIGSGKIWLQIAPYGDWRDWVPYTLAHEYHHSVWTSRHFEIGHPPVDLVNHLVFEGRADSFASLAYAGRLAPWTKALSPDQEKATWKFMQPYLSDTSYQTRKRFLIGGSSNIPYSAGYTIGFHIVQKFLKNNPEMDIGTWTGMDPYDIFLQSGYDGRGDGLK